MRMGLALAIITDTIERLLVFDILTSERGILPTLFMEAVVATILRDLPWLPNVYFLTPSDAAQKFWLVCQLLLAFALLVGVGGRAVLLMLFYLICCGNLRILTTLKGGDIIVPWMIVLALCLPVTQVWAWKKTLARATAAQTAACFFFVVVLYHAAGMLKTDPEWWTGNAIGKTFAFGIMTTEFGRWLTQFENILTILSPLVPYSEICLPLLLFVPHRYVRMGICVFFLLFHASLGLSLWLSNLTILMMSFWVALLPPEFFRSLMKRFYGDDASADNRARLRLDPAWLAMASGFLLCTAALGLAVANMGFYRHEPGLQRLSAELRLSLLRAGVRGDMSFYRGVNREKHWLRLVAYENMGSARFFNLFLDKWGGPAHDHPPENYLQEVLPLRRFRGVFLCLMQNNCSSLLPQIQKVFCERARDPITKEGPEHVEAIAYSITSGTGELQMRIVFSAECSKDAPSITPTKGDDT